MINMELGPSTLVGVGLSLIAFILYFVKTKKPDVSRDYDLFFSSVGLLCGGILIFQGWRLDPILLLCQILSSATAIFFIGESLWLRGTKSKNRNFLAPKISYGKKNFRPEDPVDAFKIQKLDGDCFSQDQESLAKRKFFSDHEQGDLDFLKEKAFSPYETHSINTETSQQYFVKNKKKKRAYQEKKIPMYYQLKKIDMNFDYIAPIDYCHITFCTKE